MFREDPEDIEAKKVFGTTRTPMYFKGTKKNVPLMLEKNGWCLHYFNIRPDDCSDYVIFRKKDLEACTYYDRLPVIEFQLKNHTLEFKCWAYGTILDNIPMEVNEMITEFQEQFKTTDTKPVPVRYLKLYIAVLDEVPDGMVPTLVAHSMLGAHLYFYNTERTVNKATGKTVEIKINGTLYDQWLVESFRKCVVKVNRKEFEKIKQIPKVYLGHENKTLQGEKSCAVPLPVWNDDIPKVLKFAKLWKPNNA